MVTKNVNAIDKIIAELSGRDFRSAWDKYPLSYRKYRAGLSKRKPKGYYPFAYSLSADTEEARQIKKDYLHDIITEPEYKAYCLKYNLRRESK